MGITRPLPFLLRHRDAFLTQIHNPHSTLRASFEAIATLDYTPSFGHCVAAASGFLAGLSTQ